MRVAHSDETTDLKCDECGKEVLSLVYLGGTNSGPEAPLGDMSAVCVKCLREAIIELNVAMGPKVAEMMRPAPPPPTTVPSSGVPRQDSGRKP